MSYADVMYLGIEYLDAEFVNGKWFYERSIGEVYDFLFQNRVKLLNQPQEKPRHGGGKRPAVRLFGDATPSVTALRWLSTLEIEYLPPFRLPPTEDRSVKN